MLIVGAALLICFVTANCPGVQSQMGATNDPNKTLIFVHTVLRHGNMTPLQQYPTDPYINETFDPFGKIELTSAGKQLLFEVGGWLRQLYDNYLGKYYDPDVLLAQSISYNLNMMSTAAALAGLFPPADTPLDWNTQLNWQPIPIYATPVLEETILLTPTPCPRYNEAIAEAYAPFLAENRNFLDNLSVLTGWNFTTSTYGYTIYNTLFDEANYGLTLPEWTNEYYPTKLTSLAAICYTYNSYTDELKRITPGPLIQQIINDWTQKINGTITPSKQKMIIYGGHAEIIINLLNGLNLWNYQLPVHGAVILFELLQDKNTGVYGVQMYMRNSSKGNANPLTIPGCDNFCPLETFIELTKHIIPTNLKMQCESKPKSSSSSS